jgi:cell division transport system permease protein
MIVAVALLLAGCTSADEKDEGRLEQRVESDTWFTVFLTEAVTAPEKTAVEKHLRDLPDVTDVVFEDHAAAFERMKELYAGSGESMPAIAPELLPESFIVTMTDQAALRTLRGSPTVGEIEKLPGVRRVVIRCSTAADCRTAGPQPS